MKQRTQRVIGHDTYNGDRTHTCRAHQCVEDVEDGSTLCDYHRELLFDYAKRHATGAATHIEPDRTAGFVYFMRFGDLIKIGWSRTPQRREGQLKPDAVLHVQPGTRQDESRLHAAFDDLLVPDLGREYFRAEPALLDFIAALHC